MRFFGGVQESRGSAIATVIPIWVDTECKPVKLRLITADTELLLGLEVIGALDSEVNFKRRNLQVGPVEWKETVRNNKNRWVLPPAPTARGRTKLGEYFAKMGNIAIAVLEARADADGDFELRKAQNQKKGEKRK